jgi:hypothetical protein
VLARSSSTVDAPPRFSRRPPKKSMPAAQKVARCARGGSCASASGEAVATFSVPDGGMWAVKTGARWQSLESTGRDWSGQGALTEQGEAGSHGSGLVRASPRNCPREKGGQFS